MSWIKTTAALAVGLALVACSKQEPQALQSGAGVNTINTTSTYTGPRETVSLSLQAGFGLKESESEARALEGSVFYRGRLRPKLVGDKANVLLFLGSKASGLFSRQDLEFDYDATTNSIHYRGKMTVPAGLLQASDLKMLLVVANKTKISDATLTMNDVKTSVFDNSSSFEDGGVLDIDVPYFSDWLDVTQYVDGTKLDVARTKVRLRPQGHVVKMELSSNVTARRNIVYKKLQVESNAITNSGTYALPTDASGIDVKPAFTPVLTAPETNKFRRFEIPLGDLPLENGKTRTIYLWVEQIPGVRDPWTRTFANVFLNEPVLSQAFTRAWWAQDRLLPVYYSKSDFSRTGSTMGMHLDNTMVVQPIQRLAYTIASPEYYTQSVAVPANAEPLKLGIWDSRQMTDYSNYTAKWLISKGYLGDTPNPIVFTGDLAKEPNSRDVEFYIPTIEEFTAVFPTDPTVAGAFYFNSRNTTGEHSVSERVRLGNRKTSVPVVRTSSYKYFNKGLDGKSRDEVVAVRFKGAGDHQKMIYRYRSLQLQADGVASVQLQTCYLGEFYPEIQTAQDAVDYYRNYPGATHPGDVTPEERILVLNRNNWRSDFRGNLYWINKLEGNMATYLVYNYVSRNNAIQQQTVDVNAQSQAEAVLLLMRDVN